MAESAKKEPTIHAHPLRSNKMAFLIIGILEASWAPLVPLVKSGFSLDEGQLGLLMLCLGLGSLLALPCAGWLCMRFGAKASILLSSLILGSSLLVISMMANLWLTAVMLLIFGASMIVIDVSANVNAVALEHCTNRSLMSGFHGGYALGTLLGAGTMSVLFTIGLVPVWAVVVCLILSLGALFTFGTDLLLKEELRPGATISLSDSIRTNSAIQNIGQQKVTDRRANGEKTKCNIQSNIKGKDDLQAQAQRVNDPTDSAVKKIFSIPIAVVTVGLICFIMYAVEGAIMGWAAIFVSQERGVSIRYAGYFFTSFALATTTFRFLGDRIVEALGRRRVVWIGASVVTVGLIAVITIPHFVAAALGFGLVGIGTANIIPQMISFGANVKGMAVEKIISFINALGYSGILVGPVVMGFIAKHFGLHTSFAALAVFTMVVALVTYNLLKEPDQGEPYIP